jgi:hypothetical protein
VCPKDISALCRQITQLTVWRNLLADNLEKKPSINTWAADAIRSRGTGLQSIVGRNPVARLKMLRSAKRRGGCKCFVATGAEALRHIVWLATICSRNVGICVFWTNPFGSPGRQNPPTKTRQLPMNRASASERYFKSRCTSCVSSRLCKRTTCHRIEACHLSGLASAAYHLRRLSRRAFGIFEYVVEATQAHADEGRHLQQSDYSSRGGICSSPKKLTIEKNVGFQCAAPSAPVTSSKTERRLQRAARLKVSQTSIATRVSNSG